MDDPAWPSGAQRAYEAALKSTRSLPPGERWAAVAEKVLLPVFWLCAGNLCRQPAVDVQAENFK